MADNAKIFQEMRDADTHRQDMQKGIVERLRDSGPGRAVGQAYDSEVAKGIVGGLRDAYRRIFEQGFYGKDVFDGRFHMDNQVGESPDLGGRYDQRASFYGWDNGQEKGVEAEKPVEQSRERERDSDLDLGR